MKSLAKLSISSQTKLVLSPRYATCLLSTIHSSCHFCLAGRISLFLYRYAMLTVSAAQFMDAVKISGSVLGLP